MMVFIVPLKAQNKIWKRHIIDSCCSGADGVRIADINGDNLPDIATGWEEEGFTKVYLHPGRRHVKELWPALRVGNTPDVEDAFFADLDNDGAMDVITSAEGETKKIYINWSPTDPSNLMDISQWESRVLPTSEGLMQWMFGIPIQIDSLHGIDFVVGAKNREAEIGWFKAPKKPRELGQWTWNTISNATWVMSLISSDMDHDGDLDIVTSDRMAGKTNGVRWLENPGKGSKVNQKWKNHYIGARGKDVMFMDLADLDKDGLEDAIVTQYTDQEIIYMRRLDTTGTQWESYSIDIPAKTGRAKAVKAGDINGDGKIDLVHSTNTQRDENRSGVYWLSYLNTPMDAVWEWHNISGPIGYKYDRIELLDLDGDGDLDVVTTEENYGQNSSGLGLLWFENPLNYR